MDYVEADESGWICIIFSTGVVGRLLFYVWNLPLCLGAWERTARSVFFFHLLGEQAMSRILLKDGVPKVIEKSLKTVA